MKFNKSVLVIWGFRGFELLYYLDLGLHLCDIRIKILSNFPNFASECQIYLDYVSMGVLLGQAHG